MRILLHGINKFHPDLPLDPRTLLRTPIVHRIENMGTGQYVYVPLEQSLTEQIQHLKIGDTDEVSVQLSIDGASITERSDIAHWYFVAAVHSPIRGKPFLVAAYRGDSKPETFIAYFEKPVIDLEKLEQTGLIHPVSKKPVIVKVHSVVCDSIARCWVKCTFQPGGYGACDRCCCPWERFQYTERTKVGNVKYKTIYVSQDGDMRNDADFRSHGVYTDHHTAGVRSPFERLSIDMVLDFPSDYMHSVCTGSMKRLLGSWLSMTRLHLRYGQPFYKEIMTCLTYDFSRTDGVLWKSNNWKATQLRLFAIYIGQVLMKDLLPDDMYIHFLHFASSLYIMFQPNLEHLLPQADLNLKNFVRSYAYFYGYDQMVYNTHMLSHLMQDRERFGDLDSVSMFPYENFFGFCKRRIRGGHRSLEQLINRYEELRAAGFFKQDLDTNTKRIRHPKPKSPISFLFRHVFYSKLHPECYVLIDKKPAVLTSCHQDRITYRHALNARNFYTNPLHSSDLLIYLTDSDLGPHSSAPPEVITCKCLRLPYRSSFVYIPIIHTLV